VVPISTITIGVLCRNRQWILSHFLKGIQSINYDKLKINLLFILNNNTDNSEEILTKFKSENYTNYNKIEIKTKDFKDQPEDNRKLKRLENYVYISKLRNYMVSLIKNTDYFFSIDSDIIITDFEILNKLISHKKDIVGALICNGYIINSKNPFKYYNTGYCNNMKFKSITNSIIRRMLEKDELLFESDLTGAIYLISKKIYQNPNIKYKETFLGEDFYWCQCAQKEGYKIYTDISLYQSHIMSKELFEKYLKNPFDKKYYL